MHKTFNLLMKLFLIKIFKLIRRNMPKEGKTQNDSLSSVNSSTVNNIKYLSDIF